MDRKLGQTARIRAFTWNDRLSIDGVDTYDIAMTLTLAPRDVLMLSNDVHHCIVNTIVCPFDADEEENPSFSVTMQIDMYDLIASEAELFGALGSISPELGEMEARMYLSLESNKPPLYRKGLLANITRVSVDGADGLPTLERSNFMRHIARGIMAMMRFSATSLPDSVKDRDGFRHTLPSGNAQLTYIGAPWMDDSDGFNAAKDNDLKMLSVFRKNGFDILVEEDPERPEDSIYVAVYEDNADTADHNEGAVP